MEPLAVYVHIPFCPSKCGYCDFNSYALDGPIVSRTVDALLREIEGSPLAGRPAKTIFFGGGTPTFLDAASQLRILSAVRSVHPPLADCEITTEANPGTVDAEKFLVLRSGGFNRLSLGAQSFLDSDLIRLGRVHRSREIERAVRLAREAGFDNLNLDLMFALPNQSQKAWSENLSTALSLSPQHLSLYCLTIEENTAFYKERLRGELPLPDDDEQVAMYDECCARLASSGYLQYEISNFALVGRECRHNLEYWAGNEYAGYGPGAVGSFSVDSGRVRTTNWKHPVGYCEAVEAGRPVAYEVEPLSLETLRMERIMLGLRLNLGFNLAGLDPSRRGLERCLSRDWISLENDLIILTPTGATSVPRLPSNSFKEVSRMIRAESMMSLQVAIPMELQEVLDSNPAIISGAVRFKGTRVPVQALLDTLDGGTLEEFLDGWPDVTRLQAEAVIRWEQNQARPI